MIIQNRALYSGLVATTGSTLNACSKRFQAVLKNHDLEVVLKKGTLEGMELRKKQRSGKDKLIWTS